MYVFVYNHLYVYMYFCLFAVVVGVLLSKLHRFHFKHSFTQIIFFLHVFTPTFTPSMFAVAVYICVLNINFNYHVFLTPFIAISNSSSLLTLLKVTNSAFTLLSSLFIRLLACFLRFSFSLFLFYYPCCVSLVFFGAFLAWAKV